MQTENNEKLFERNLGEGRKLVPEPDQVKDVGSRLPAPLPFRKAERATPDTKVAHFRSVALDADCLEACIASCHLVVLFVVPEASWCKGWCLTCALRFTLLSALNLIAWCLCAAQFEGGDKPLPGIAKSNAKDSVAAPLTESQS